MWGRSEAIFFRAVKYFILFILLFRPVLFLTALSVARTTIWIRGDHEAVRAILCKKEQYSGISQFARL